MKTTLMIFSAALGVAVSHAEADQTSKLNEVGILPGQKRGIRVDSEERNPYAQRTIKKVVKEDTETEAAQIRRVLEKLKVVGLSQGTHGLTVLLGDLVLRQGEELPPVLVRQKDRVQVTSITPEEVELTWITESGSKLDDARKFRIPISLEPKVEVILPGQPGRLGSDEVQMDFARLPSSQEKRQKVASAGALIETAP